MRVLTSPHVLYSGYIAMFIYPYTWSFYTASVLVGIGAAGKQTSSYDLFYMWNTSSPCLYFLFVFQSCGRLREMCLPLTPLMTPLEEIVAFFGRCCSSGEHFWSFMELSCVSFRSECRLYPHPSPLCSLFFGNLYIYCAWHGHVHITGRKCFIKSHVHVCFYRYSQRLMATSRMKFHFKLMTHVACLRQGPSDGVHLSHGDQSGGLLPLLSDP